MTKILNSKNLYKGYLEVNQLTLENGDGSVFTRDWLQSKDAVCAVDRIKKEYVFVKQFRVGSKSELIELVAGVIDIEKGLSPEETIIRELMEELGYDYETVTQICKPFYVSPGKTNERIWLYSIVVSQKISDGGGLKSENEEIKSISVPESEIKDLDIVDGKTLLGLSIMKLL